MFHHYYCAVSKRCEAMGPGLGTTAAAALSEHWLSQTEAVFDFYKPLHAKYAPEAPIWITETADAACGGNPWGSTFLDTFRYVDHRRRRQERRESDLSQYPRVQRIWFDRSRATSGRAQIIGPRFFRRLMGTVVLDAGSPREGLHLYAQCLHGRPGGVALLAINNSRTDPSEITLPSASIRYTLSAPTLESASVMLNGQSLQLNPNDDLPDINGRATAAGPMHFAPATITFVAIPEAANAKCGAVKD